MMKNKKNNFTILYKISLILSFLSIILFSFELFAKDTGFIEWKAIPAANGYRVEIKSAGKIISETNVSSNIHYVDLPKGNYEFRIGVLNFFKKPVVWSYWNPLKVIISQIPILVSEREEKVIGEPLVIEGDHFLENTKVSLIKDGVTTNVDSKIVGEKQISIPTDKMQVGTYDLILENPNNKKLTKKEFLVLYNSKGGIRRKAPEKIIKKKDIEISSESLEKADVSFDESEPGKTKINIGPKSKEKLDINLENKSNLDVSVDINNRSAGKVNLNVENKSKDKITLNVTNHSKEKMIVGVIDKSKGKIDVNITPKSKQKVDIDTIFADIEDFDVTIENKAKSKFEINIGKPAPEVIVPKRTPARIINRNDISVSADSLDKVDIAVDDTKPNKLSVDIGPHTEEDLEISLENKSKENVAIDLNNKAKGSVKLLVENKSDENLAINVNNASKEALMVEILDASIGNVDITKDEKSKGRINISRSEKVVEYFDVTIENKTRDKFDINIGKKEPDPLVFKKSNEVFPRDYYTYSLKKYQDFLNGLKRTCSSSLDIPDILIEECYSRHATLNLEDIDRQVLYNFIKLNSGNYISRIGAYKFFIENCSPPLAFILELADYRLKNLTMDENEIFYIKKMKESFSSCRSKDGQ
ncbi:MAG TPA: hypothetical protein PK079_10025 [Leptospiraceae bacterium]|nr:hypothetical protein [Leptospiraceae bacterium]HMW06682.1 hypothetical protein [Leptospiraceae bacterium]HMY33603.1 hypothetical protein [Leptospiraceae bacterium]HMZ64922.1 hypothetical protein [Leptospiraceae bacterium]HNA05334.1 hypothetical protein [Leptospiraceae bacterium]